MRRRAQEVAGLKLVCDICGEKTDVAEIILPPVPSAHLKPIGENRFINTKTNEVLRAVTLCPVCYDAIKRKTDNNLDLGRMFRVRGDKK